MTGQQSTRDLIALMLEAGALQFGSFTLKSGRISPYFFNSARFRTGEQLERLGEHYARAIAAQAPGATIVFGPAYKGIPLCVAAAMALGRLVGRPVGYLFDRKEEKTHGDQGRFVGESPAPGDRLVLVDDVITDGGTKLDMARLLRGAFAAPIDLLVIAFNRMEQGPAGQDAVAGFTRETGIPVTALLTLADLEAELAAADAGKLAGIAREFLPKLREYRGRYGLPAAADR
jgi:orotate phosphoribosyltransferase